MGANLSRCEYCSHQYEQNLRKIYIKSYRKITICDKCFNMCFKKLKHRKVENEVIYIPNILIIEMLKGSLTDYIDEVTNELELKMKERKVLELLSDKYN